MGQADCKSAVAGMRHGRFDPCPSHVTNEEMDLESETPTADVPTRLTVNLTQGAMGSIILAAEAAELSKTDVVNKALGLYAFCLLMEKGGTTFYAKRGEESELVEFSKM